MPSSHVNVGTNMADGTRAGKNEKAEGVGEQRRDKERFNDLNE